MWRTMLQGAALLGLLATLAVPGSAADPPAAAKDAGGNKRLLYVVKHGSAKDMADLLSRHFQGVAEFRPLPDAFGNGLLVNAAPSVYDDVVAALDKLDRPRRTVSIEVLIAEVAAAKKDGDKPGAEAPALKEKDFTGPMADVAARMEDLQKAGTFSNLRQVQITAVEGQPESVLIGGTKPFTTGVFVTATGLATRNIVFRRVGTQVRATASVSPDQIVTVALNIEDMVPHAAEGGVSVGTDEKGKPVWASEFGVGLWDGTVSTPSGQARAVQDVQTAGKPDGVRKILVVGARVIDAEK